MEVRSTYKDTSRLDERALFFRKKPSSDPWENPPSSCFEEDQSVACGLDDANEGWSSRGHATSKDRRI